eukprot:6191814-Pleurochrysis_carterae.AAC.1
MANAVLSLAIPRTKMREISLSILCSLARCTPVLSNVARQSSSEAPFKRERQQVALAANAAGGGHTLLAALAANIARAGRRA